MINMPSHARLLGLDPGTKTIGVAMSDAMQMIASPLGTIKRKKWKQDAEALMAIITEHHIGGIVVGYPLNMDGSEGPRCQSVKAFVRNLEQLCKLPIILQDERMSSQAVERTMLEADISRAKRAENVDKLAASYILQGYLNATYSVIDNST